MKAIRFYDMALVECGAVRVRGGSTTAGDIAQGRQAMLAGNYQLALDYFWLANK